MNSPKNRYILLTTLLALILTLHPLPARTEEAALDIALDDISPSLVIISCEVDGEEQSGNGVIVEMDGKPYLLTNQHIILGAAKLRFITATGGRLAPKRIELSSDRDLARLALDEGSSLLSSPQANMDTPIVIIAGVNGQGLKKEQGKIIGVGGSKIEISAQFESSSNGAPVLNANKEVVGIASYSRESSFHAMKTGTRFEDSTRHFCYRINNCIWEPVNWKTYNRKYGTAFRKHQEFSERILSLLKDREHFTSKKANKLAGDCRTHARQLRLLIDQRDLTSFLQSEFENQAELFEYAAQFFHRQATQTN